MALWIVCNRWIDETKGWRCVLIDGHDGPCQPAQAVSPTRISWQV